MQSLDIISINFWQILISLVNLLILFLVVKHLLWGPIKRIMAQRQQAVDKEFNEAQKEKDAAAEERKLWEEKMAGAEAEAGNIVKAASEEARLKSDKIISSAMDKASEIVKHAEHEAATERKRVEKEVKAEIVDVSTKLTEKMLGREINAEDHRRMIDSFIEDLGEES